MAKGKSLNPADAHRKAQRAKELKKNKEKRAKTRETATLKKDTSGIEKEIQDLEDLGELDQKQIAQLKELRTELERVRKIKQDYTTAHPEQAHLVRGLKGPRRNQDSDTPGGSAPPAVRTIFGKNGLPIRPERSLYYDPVMNPYGMPPPGMPYAERPLLPHEIEEDQRLLKGELTGDNDGVDIDMGNGSDESDSDDSDTEDIALPTGPPPDKGKEDESDSDSEDSDVDIPMPPGPPPPKLAPPLPQGHPLSVPLLPVGGPYMTPFTTFAPPFVSYPSIANVPPPPPGAPAGSHSGYTLPFAQNAVLYPPQMPGPGLRLPRDRQHMEAARVLQDPLSNLPHVTFQAHQAQRHQPPELSDLSAGLPAKLSGTAHSTTSATVFAEPELRDFKKEATAFVPASMRRAAKKGPVNSTTTVVHVDAAPGGHNDTVPAEARKDLVGMLNTQLGAVNEPATTQNKNQAGQGKDDYDKFLAEVGSFL